MCIECLLVDDDPDDRELFGLMLEAAAPHCTCRHAIDGVEAIQLLHEDPDFRPSFILLDMNMPRMSGLQTLEAIRQIPHLSETPVFMYSTGSDDRLRQRCKDLGCKDYIVKSPSFEEMVSHIRRIIGQL